MRTIITHELMAIAGVDEGATAKTRFRDLFCNLMQTKSVGNRKVYKLVLATLDKYCPTLEKLTLDDIDRLWIMSFISYMKEHDLSDNSISIHIQKMKAVYNYALDEELTKNNPLRKISVKVTHATKKHLEAVHLRQIYNYKGNATVERYRDYFMLSFFLIGCNPADLFRLKIDNIVNGRIEYDRKKTGRHYSIFLHNEAREIIQRYCKGTYIIGQIKETNLASSVFYANIKTNHYINMIDDVSIKGKFTFYWARRAWATIAASLDIPKEVIAAALGHGKFTVTDIYIDYDIHKVDEANRKVIDYVLYGELPATEHESF